MICGPQSRYLTHAESVTMSEAGTSAESLVPSRSRKIHVLVLLCAAYLVSMLDRQIVSLLVEPIKKDLGLSDTQIGLLQGFGFVVFYAALGVPLARFADRGNCTRLIAMGMTVWSLAAMASGAARGFVGLFAARAFVGAGEATLSPAAYSILGETFDKRQLGRVLGIFHMAAGVGLGLALVIGGWTYGLLQSLAGQVYRGGLARAAVGRSHCDNDARAAGASATPRRPSERSPAKERGSGCLPLVKSPRVLPAVRWICRLYSLHLRLSGVDAGTSRSDIRP